MQFQRFLSPASFIPIPALFVLFLLSPASAGAQQIFEDVPPSSQYYNTANRMYPTITSGCEADPRKFCPDNNLYRWQMAMFVIRAIYGGDSFSYSTTPYFNDVPQYEGGYPVAYFPHVQKMYELGITTGCDIPGAFCPWADTLNYMAAVFTVRAAQYKAGNPLYLDPTVYPPPPDNNLPTSPAAWFSDVPPNGFPFQHVQKIRDLGVITTGCATGYFCPNDAITRGQMTYYVVHGILDEYPPPTGLTSQTRNLRPEPRSMGTPGPSPSTITLCQTRSTEPVPAA